MKILSCGAALLFAGHAAHAEGRDTLVLSNGDRLSGTVLAEEEGLVLFDSEMLGLLEMDAAGVRVERGESVSSADSPPAEESGGGEAAEPDEEAAKPPPAAASQGPDTVETHETTEGAKPSPAAPGRTGWLPKLKLPEKWSGELGLSYLEQQGRGDLRQAGVQSKLARQGERVQAEWRGHYRDHATDDGEDSSQTAMGAGQDLRYQWKDRFSVESHTVYEDDDYRKKRREFSQAAAVGFTPIDNEKVRLHVAPGVKVENVRKAKDPGQNGTRYKAHAREELAWQIREDLKLGQEARYNVDPRNPEDWDVEVNAYLETQFPDSVNLRLHYRYEFDRQLPEEDQESSEVGASVVIPF